MLSDKYVNTEILIMRDFNCRMGEDWRADKDNFSEKRYGKDKSCNVEGN
jgi:hypothetical protein